MEPLCHVEVVGRAVDNPPPGPYTQIVHKKCQGCKELGNTPAVVRGVHMKDMHIPERSRLCFDATYRLFPYVSLICPYAVI